MQSTMNNRKNLFNLVHGIYSVGEACQWSHVTLCQRLREALHAPLERKRPNGRAIYTRADKAYAAAVSDTLQAATWSRVEFVYRDNAGVIYSTHKGSSHKSTEIFYASGRGSELGDMECAHVWKGTAAPYTPWTIANKKADK